MRKPKGKNNCKNCNGLGRLFNVVMGAYVWTINETSKICNVCGGTGKNIRKREKRLKSTAWR